MLFASDISKSYTNGSLFSGLTFSVSGGDRIALIGPNGSGKTTLMDILTGEIVPETGSISRQRNVTMGYLKQEPSSSTGKPLLQEVLDARSEANALVKRNCGHAGGPVIGNRPRAPGVSIGTPQQARHGLGGRGRRIPRARSQGDPLWDLVLRRMTFSGP